MRLAAFSRFVCWCAVACVVGAAGAASAQVAVAVTLPESNPTLRDVAGGVIDVVDDEWQMLSPQLDPVEVALCKTDAPCLQQQAASKKASHLLVVGVAGLGVRDYVVSVQLYDANGQKLVDDNAVQTASSEPSLDGRQIGQKLLQVPGVPRRAAPAVGAATPTPAPVSALAVTGVALVGTSAVVAAAASAAFLSLAVEPESAANRFSLGTGAVVSASVVAALAVSGAACVVVDRLYPASSAGEPAAVSTAAASAN